MQINIQSQFSYDCRGPIIGYFNKDDKRGDILGPGKYHAEKIILKHKTAYKELKILGRENCL